jgi:DNA-binding NtrC family response regulator
MASPLAASPSPPSKSLLVVENDARIVELMCLFLGRRGYEVRSARSLEEAREHLAAERPALMLSDIELGRSNGRDFLPQLSREGLLPRTLVVSGFLDADIADELRCVPEVVGVLAKPFEFDRLHRCIEEALQQGGSPSTAPLVDASRADASRADAPRADVSRGGDRQQADAGVPSPTASAP